MPSAMFCVMIEFLMTTVGLEASPAVTPLLLFPRIVELVMCTLIALLLPVAITPATPCRITVLVISIGKLAFVK